MLSVRNLTKTYKLGKRKNSKSIVALNNVSVDFPDKGLVFLLGKSGSGKSTLLNAIGGLDTFDSGEIIIKGKSSSEFKQSDFDSYRNTFIGFIFQEYNILNEFTVGKNLALALELQGKRAEREDVERLLEQVDLKDYYKRKPNQLSGGQKQRVAIARALIKDPEIIMADEPTGALDSNTGKQVMDTLKELSKKKLVIIVSHDREFAEIYGDRVIELKDGKIIKDETKNLKVAQKTESGVSFIGNKIIHIKKGQRITQADLLAINKMIIANVANEETLISFDSDTNKDVKKSAFITNDGNREVFEKTKDEDIKRKNHNPKDFKLIKSKLKKNDAFKVGVSSLKHKPFKLLFTVLLASIAFCMFGIVDTLASFNQARSIYDSIEALELKTLAVSKYDNTSSSYNNSLTLSDEDITSFNELDDNYKFQPVIASGTNFSYEYTVDDGSGEWTTNLDYQYSTETAKKYPLRTINDISGIMGLNANTASYYNLRLSYGRYPENEAEICISQNMYNALVDNSDNVSSWQDIVDKKITLNLYLNQNYHNFLVVGVVKNDTNMTDYENLDISEDSNMFSQMMYNSEFETVIKYGLINMCYVKSETFNTLSENYSSENIRYEAGLRFENGSTCNSYSTNNVNIIEDIEDSKLDYITFKPGKNKDNMSTYDIVINADHYMIFNCLDSEEFKTKVMTEDLKLNLYRDFPYDDDGIQPNYSLNIVGVSNYGYSFIKNEMYVKMFGGYDYAITRLTDNRSSNKTIIDYVNNYNSNNIGLKVQFKSTPIFDNFGDTIEDLSAPLLYVGLALAVFAGFMLMNFISTSISYKKREIGVLRAIGARGKDVFSIFFSESFVICLMNFFVSTIGCIIACIFINRGIIVDLGFSITLLSFGIRQIVLLFGVSLLVAFISTFFPVYSIAKKNPIDSINNR